MWVGGGGGGDINKGRGLPFFLLQFATLRAFFANTSTTSPTYHVSCSCLHTPYTPLAPQSQSLVCSFWVLCMFAPLHVCMSCLFCCTLHVSFPATLHLFFASTQLPTTAPTTLHHNHTSTAIETTTPTGVLVSNCQSARISSTGKDPKNGNARAMGSIVGMR